jgi:hypothetical protein
MRRRSWSEADHESRTIKIPEPGCAPRCRHKRSSRLRQERRDLASRQDGCDQTGIAETKAIAEEGFIYGLPIVMNYAVMYEYAVDRTRASSRRRSTRSRTSPRVHRQGHGDRDAEQRHAVFLLVDGPARRADGALGPAVEKSRYYAVQLEDGNTFNFGYIGSRATGNEAGDYMVAGPDWKGETPAGIKKVFRSTTQFAIAGYRTQLFNPADMPNVIKVQDGYKGQPLSAYLKRPAPPAPPAINFPKIDKEMVKTGFFDYLDFALQFAPPGPEEKDIRAKLARIGIGPGKTFDFKDLSLEHKLEVGLGMKDGEAKVDQYLLTGEKIINGWRSARISATATSSRQLAATRGRRQRRYLRQRRGRGHVSHDQNAGQRRRAGREQAQLHADLRQGPISAGQRLLVGDDVRRQDAIAGREPDQSLSRQLADVARAEEERGRLTHPFTSRRTRPGRTRSPTGYRTQRPGLPGDAPVLAED